MRKLIFIISIIASICSIFLIIEHGPVHIINLVAAISSALVSYPKNN